MVTTVGTESTFDKLIQNLLILEHDAIAAYQSTIERLDDPTSKAKIAEFKGDHEAHVAELTRMEGQPSARRTSFGRSTAWSPRSRRRNSAMSNS